MAHESNETALATIEGLQDRLARIEFFLSGSDEAQRPLGALSKGKDRTVLARLANLETTLHKMAKKSNVIQDLLQLGKFLSCDLICGFHIKKLFNVFSTLAEAQYPDLFHPTKADEVPSTLSTEELLAVITAHATLYHETASRLTSIRDLTIPPTSLSTSLIALYPRLANLELQQNRQAEEMAELRARSAKLIQRWYELRVLGHGECWAEWEVRMEGFEKEVRKLENGRRREEEERERYLT